MFPPARSVSAVVCCGVEPEVTASARDVDGGLEYSMWMEIVGCDSIEMEMRQFSPDNRME